VADLKSPGKAIAEPRRKAPTPPPRTTLIGLRRGAKHGKY